MALFRSNALPTTPTLPKGVEVASFERYLDAQQAVDHLSDEEFPVQHVTIVGTDLHMVERITGRLTYARVAGAGAMSGAWFGLMISVVLWLFTTTGEEFPLLAGVLIGAAFGMLFGVVSYALTGGKRDFTSSSQVVAGRYAIVCATEHASHARELVRGAQVAHRANAPAGPGTQPYAGPRANPFAGPGSHPGDQDRPGDQGRPGDRSGPAGGTPDEGSPAGALGSSTGGSGTPAAGPDGGGGAAPTPPGEGVTADGDAADTSGDTRPTRFGSRADEAPRYGVRISPEPSDDARDGESP